MAIRRLHRRLLGWYRDDLINRLIRNLGYLLSGNLVAAELGLSTERTQNRRKRRTGLKHQRLTGVLGGSALGSPVRL